MEITKTKPFSLALGIAIALALPSYSFATGVPNYVTTERSNSANAMFSIEQNGVALEVMTEFGYFKSSTVGDIGLLPIPVDAGGGVVTEPGVGGPFFPGNTEHAYLILNVMEVMPAILPPPEQIPVPTPFPGPDPIIVDPIVGPGNPIVDPIIEPIIDPVPPVTPPGIEPGPGGGNGSPIDPTLPPIEPPPFPNEPIYEVLYFELTPAQIKISQQNTSVELDTCQQPQPTMLFEPCGVISISWTNNTNESMKSKTTSLTKSSNGMFGQPMTVKGTSGLFFSSASVTMNALGQMLTNDLGGRSASNSKQAFHLDNENVILN